MKQILINLLSNAVKYTAEGGRITVSHLLNTDGRLEISITDTGIGMTQEQIQKAMQPFGQVDAEMKREGSGAGLGLTLVAALLKLHGGELELLSQKGIGTTATIIVPARRVVQPKKSVKAPA